MDWSSSLSTTPWMGTWLIILLLFLFLLGGNNGFWGFWGNNNAAAWLLGQANSNNNHDNTVELINNNTMRQNQLMAQQNANNQSQLISTGFCNTNSNIEKAILQWQQNTASIIAAGTANTQKILDMMCSQEIAQLRSELTQARNSISNNVQTQYLISQLRPYPVPSWEVSSPYVSVNTPTTTA